MKRIAKSNFLLFNILIGFGLGWLLAFGILNLNDSLIVISIALLVAGLHGGIWLIILRDLSTHQKLKNVVIAIQLSLGLIIGGTYCSQRITFQNQPLLSKNYVKNFEKLWFAIDQAYPYFDLKKINWDEVYEQYAPLITDVQDDQAFLEVISQMLAELDDAHTDVVSPYLGEKVFASVINRGELAIIHQVGYSGEIAGLESGMLLLAVNGKTVEEVVSTNEDPKISGSTPWMKKIKAYENLMVIPEDPTENLVVTVIDQEGVEKNIEIELLEPPANWQIKPIDHPAVVWEKITDDIGYIRVDRLWNNSDDILADFDLALNHLINMKGIILDLRLNGGGDSKIGEKIAGRFLLEPFTYGQDIFRKRLYKFAWRESIQCTVKPRMDVYTGELVVLTDYAVMSSAEWLVGALVDSNKAISIGRVTGGASGNPIHFSLPGGTVRYSTAMFIRPDGSLVEGRGYAPRIEIEWDTEDYINKIDPDIQAAIEWIES